MRLSHKRKVAAKKAGVIPRARRTRVEVWDGRILHLKPGEAVIYMASKQRVSKSSRLQQDIVDAWIRSRQQRIQVVTHAPTSGFSRLFDVARNAFRGLISGRISPSLSVDKSISVTGHKQQNVTSHK